MTAPSRAKATLVWTYKHWLRANLLRFIYLICAANSAADMSKPYTIKDPTAPPALRALRTVFSRPASGVLGAAVAVRAGPLVAKKLLPGHSNSWVTTLGSSLLGFGVGYTSMSLVFWIRRQMITSLLQYRGWITNPKSSKTKVWAMLLKVLLGPGPHGTQEFQSCLPQMPVPPLEQTCDRYLLSVEPLLTEDEYAHTKSLVERLLQNEGPQLQKYLLKRKGKLRNWLADWWLANSYLLRRESIAIHVNFFMTSTFLPNYDPLSRAANVVYETYRYSQMIKLKTLPPDIIMGIVPICMDGTRFMFSTTRVPGEHIDTLEVFPESKHIIVFCERNYYVLDLYAKDTAGRMTLLTKRELRSQLEYIQTTSRASRKHNKVAALTAEARPLWAKHRQMLLDNPVNAAALKAIESSVFFIVLGDSVPKNMSEQTKITLCGDGDTRWFDKSLLLACYGDTSMGGANMEHTGADATHFSVMLEHVLQMEEYGPDGQLPKPPGEIVRKLDTPHLLEWDLDSMQDIIDNAYTVYKKSVDAMDCIALQTEFGKQWMKSQRISPDGFLQMAIQLAFHRLHKTFTKTYEPASHRMFDQGRTENINPVSGDSVDFVMKMDSPSASRQDKLNALHKSIRFQSDMRLQATAGWGCDRHMLGLSLAARELGMDMPPVFTDKAFNLPMKLSTSQVPTTIGSLGLPIEDDSILGGFGPACEEGYGLLYCPIAENSFNFNITSWKTCPETDSVRFREAMLRAMRDMRDLLEGKAAPPVQNTATANI